MLTHQFERLEDRTVPTLGLPWMDPNRITISFAPEGTSLGSQQSNLESYFTEAGYTSKEGRLEILKAFQAWVQHSNINFALANDSGSAFGTLGKIQHDSRFGDIRIGEASLSNTALATSVPVCWKTGTWSGDVFLNRNYASSLERGMYDLFSIALHESGHALGFDHSDGAHSVMNSDYSKSKVLSAEEIAQVQAIYGVRKVDRFDAQGSNSTTNSASRISVVDWSGNNRVASLLADITTSTDVDVYQFTTGHSASEFAISLETNGISLLAGKVELLNSSGRVIATATKADPLSADVNLTAKLAANTTYSVRVSASAKSDFNVGAYKLTVGPIGMAAPVINLTFDEGTMHFNDQMKNATPLTWASVRTLSQTKDDYYVRGTIGDATDVDFFKFRTSDSASGSTVANIALWGEDNSTFKGRLAVFDDSGAALTYQYLANDGHNMAIHVENLDPQREYFIRVDGATTVGNFFLHVDFVDHSIGDPVILINGVSDASATMTLAEPSIMVFGMMWGSCQPASTKFEIFNDAGELVQTVNLDGSVDCNTFQLFLMAGTYSIKVTCYDSLNQEIVADLTLCACVADIDIDPFDTDGGAIDAVGTGAGTSGTGGTSGGTTTTSTSTAKKTTDSQALWI